MAMPDSAALVWRFENESWWAESPQFPEWSAGAASLDEARLLAHSGLAFMGASSVSDPFTFLLASVTT